MEMVGGAGLGILIGAVIGLSSSPTVATLLGALTALLAGFFGLQANVGTAQTKRIIGFGFVCTATIVFGIYARTHQWLSENAAAASARWRTVDNLYSNDDVKRLVTLELLNVDLKQDGPLKVDATSPGLGVLHAAKAQACADLAPEPSIDSDERRTRFIAAGGTFRALAEAVEAVEPAKQGQILESAYTLACVEPR